MPMLGLPDAIRACLFDLDGVLTQTAKVHAAAWKQMFDMFLRTRAARSGEAFVPFDPAHDYDRYVDGLPRYDGVRSFLASRGIELPDGTPGDPPGAETIRGLGNLKNEIVLQMIRSQGVEAYEGSVRYVRAARAAGLRCAVVSSSANCRDVLEGAGIAELFDERVDGIVLEREHLHGKPAPDTFLFAARALGEEKRVRRGLAVQMLALEHNAVNALVEELGDPGTLQHVAAVRARGDNRAAQARGASRAHVAHRALVRLYALAANHLQNDLILEVSETADRLRAGRIARCSVRELDSARREEGAYAVVARQAVDVTVVVVSRIEGDERFAAPRRACAQEHVEHLLPRGRVHLRRLGEHAVEIKQACADRIRQSQHRHRSLVVARSGSDEPLPASAIYVAVSPEPDGGSAGGGAVAGGSFFVIDDISERRTSTPPAACTSSDAPAATTAAGTIPM